ncbi:MAG: flagellar hook-associated protein FlgK [Calditrichia bacterium]
MSGIFQSLDIARKAIWSSRLGMDVTSHNIANVNTEGYTRQRMVSQAAQPLQLVQGQLGMGVALESLHRVRNTMLDQQFRQTNHLLGNATAKEDLYSQIEIIFQEPSESAVGSQMNDFFLEFSNLASSPEDTAIRNTIREKATTLVDAFNTKSQQLSSMQNSIQSNVKASIEQVNSLTRQIAELNRQIVMGNGKSMMANDLMDRRDLLLDRLSEYTKITVSEGANGQISVSADGVNLVSGINANELSFTTTGDGSDLQIEISNSNGQSANFKSGKIGALLEMHNQKIPELQVKLDNLAKAFIEEVNRIHSAGYGLPVGNPPQPSTGVNFFEGNSASTIRINSDIMENINNIAASSDGDPGNGDVALAISNIRNSKVFNGGTQTLEDYYTDTVKTLAVEIEQAGQSRQSQQLLKNQVQNQRDAESGVSLDEEMTNLIKYQRSFEAASKVVKVVDEMLATIVNMV